MCTNAFSLFLWPLLELVHTLVSPKAAPHANVNANKPLPPWRRSAPTSVDEQAECSKCTVYLAFYSICILIVIHSSSQKRCAATNGTCRSNFHTVNSDLHPFREKPIMYFLSMFCLLGPGRSLMLQIFQLGSICFSGH